MKRMLFAKRAFTTVASSFSAPRLLLVYHSRTGFASSMADALELGAREAAEAMECSLFVDRVAASNATSKDVLGADGYLFCAPENLATVSGEMKEFFDRCYYDCFEWEKGKGDADETSALLGRPYGLAIAGGSDGEGARRQVERICTGWRLRNVSDSIVERNGLAQTAENILAHGKRCSPEAAERCKQLGGLVAATMLL